MSAMEQSLRRALEAGDATDPTFRESIYSASERALERMLAAKATEPEAAHLQRVRLAETINRVEEDYFVPAADPDDVSADYPFHESWPEGAAGSAGHPEGPAWHAEEETRERFPDEAAAGEAEPILEDDEPEPEPRPGAAPAVPSATQEDAAADAWSPGADRRVGEPKAGSRFRPFVFGLVVLLLTLLVGIYFFYSTVFGPMAVRGTSTAAAVATASGSATPEAAEGEWITLFDGTQLEMISTPTGGKVSAVTGAGDRPAVRLAAAGGEGEVDVSVGPGVVDRIKGHKVRVEITAGSSDGEGREFGVRCLFGGDTVCGRQRFSTPQSSEAFVFDMTLPGDPAASGTLAIDPSFGAGTKDIDLYSVRLRTVDGA